MHFVLTRVHPGRTFRSVTLPKIGLGQARLTSEFFGDGFPEKKLQLVSMSNLIIMLSLGPGCYILTPLRDRRPHRSIPSQERPLLATSMCPVPAHVPCCVTTLGPLQSCTPCLRNCDTRARETTRVDSNTIL
jgi:hypothetical protein